MGGPVEPVGDNSQHFLTKVVKRGFGTQRSLLKSYSEVIN